MELRWFVFQKIHLFLLRGLSAVFVRGKMNNKNRDLRRKLDEFFYG